LLRGRVGQRRTSTSVTPETSAPFGPCDDCQKQDEVNIKASVSTNLPGETIHVGPQNNDNNSHAGACAGSNSVFLELMRQVPRLSAEEPEAILRFIIRLDEIYALGLNDDGLFVVRILPLVSGAVLGYFGDCLRNGRTWEQRKSEHYVSFFPISFAKG